MSASTRLSASDRREHIVQASLHLFARRGLHGVTTKEVAETAGVSEALLYKHFPSKEALYEEIRQHCLAEARHVGVKVASLKPSTSTLVLAVHMLTTSIFEARKPEPRKQSISRILIASLADDGNFVRPFLKAAIERWVPLLVECIAAARRAGDLVDDGDAARARVWLAHHLAGAMAWFHLPKKPIVSYGIEGDALTDEVVLFSLRGLGLTDAAIKAHYNPAGLRALARTIRDGIGK